jgi:hypothetical protein
MHPLQQDISGLSDNQLEEQIKDLTKKYFTIMRVSPTAANQLLMLLEGYRSEKDSREFRRMQEQSKNGLGDEFDGLINIG